LSKIKTREELKLEIEEARRQGKKIVTTNGCFDILHVGHLRCLRKAKQLGDILIVAINSDDSVRAIKGEKRPLVIESERAEILTALECVDYVTVFSELDPIQLLKEVRPDVHVKGGDYISDALVESGTVASYGGVVHILELVAERSTSSLIKLIVDRYVEDWGSLSKRKLIARRIVHDIIKDITNRRGLRQEWEQIDEEVTREIGKKWRKIVTSHLELKG
jgi:rfaE bifunctional protein nucleotidyltransferase chain/domain